MSEPVFLPLMTEPQPDTAARKQWVVQSIPFGLPNAKRVKWDPVGEPAVWPSLPEGRDPWP